MKLYGSTTSPFVRRLRLFLSDDTYEFINLDIFSEEGEAVLTQLNPTRKIPMLVDDDQVIFDSNVIYRYIADKHDLAKLTWDQENQLTLINAANDSMVELFLCVRSGFNEFDDKLFFNLQRQRIEQVLSTLNTAVENGEFADWDYPAMCLFALIDWAMFRERADFSKFGMLISFFQQNKIRPRVIETDPRK